MKLIDGNVYKSFGAVGAMDGVSIGFQSSQIHTLVEENSTGVTVSITEGARVIVNK